LGCQPWMRTFEHRKAVLEARHENPVKSKHEIRVRFAKEPSEYCKARVISLRKALPYERKRYEQYLKDELGEG
jgi:uncharacterized DUF497 family protein